MSNIKSFNYTVKAITTVKTFYYTFKHIVYTPTLYLLDWNQQGSAGNLFHTIRKDLISNNHILSNEYYKEMKEVVNVLQ